MPTLSIVIRAWNEERQLETLLRTIREQDYPQTEIELIIVDCESSDDTVAVAKEAGAKVVSILQGDFSYPKALNVGCEVATGTYLCFVSAHCQFFLPNSLSAAVSHFNQVEVAGVYGPVVPLPHATFAEKLLAWPIYKLRKLVTRARPIKKLKLGILGNTNAMIRRELWESHPFDEAYGIGGEDYAWASWALESNYSIIFEPAFTIRHSHHLGFRELLAQQAYFKKSIAGPHPFTRDDLSHRNELNHDN